MPTPEIPLDKRVVERPTEVFSETLTQAGVTSTPTNVQPVLDDKGQPVISTPLTQSAKIQLPSEKTLIERSKGRIVDAITWLAKFFLRMSKKEAYANRPSE